jgi:hypothetical protein
MGRLSGSGGSGSLCLPDCPYRPRLRALLDDSLLCDSACMLSLSVAPELLLLSMAAPLRSVGNFHPEAAMASKDSRVDEDLVHPQLAPGLQHQRGLYPPKFTTAGLHGFAAVKILTAELKYALGDAGPVEYCSYPLDRGNLLVGVPAGVTLICHVHHVGRRWIVGLDRIHQKMLVSIAPGAPKGLVRRLVGFVRNSGRWLGRHGSVPRHQKCG